MLYVDFVAPFSREDNLEAYLGTILPVAFAFAPRGWHLCDGTLIDIRTNGALFSLLGTQYGGDGVSTFALPNLQGRVPVNQGPLSGGSTYAIGQSGGSETVTLNTQQMPLHTHNMTVDGVPGTTSKPATNYFALTQEPGADDPFNSFTPSPSRPATLNSNSLQSAGGNLPHENRQPYLVINYIICLSGIFPPRQ